MKPSSDQVAILVSMKETEKMTTMSRTMINRLRLDGRFPKAVSLGDRRVAFVRAEVVAWVAAKIAAREVAR